MRSASHFLWTLFIMAAAQILQAQGNSDEGYRRPLKDVLMEIEKRYDVQIKYADSMVKDKIVPYAEWRFRSDVEITLDNVLRPLDMKVRKEKDKVYRLGYYEYYRWTVEDGWAELDRIASQYHNVAEWEKRKSELKSCIMQAIQLSPLRQLPLPNPSLRRDDPLMVIPLKTLRLRFYPGYTLMDHFTNLQSIRERSP